MYMYVRMYVCLAGLKNSFRLEVQKARERLGLDVNNTNAPSNQMEEISKDIVVCRLVHTYITSLTSFSSRRCQRMCVRTSAQPFKRWRSPTLKTASIEPSTTSTTITSL